MGKEGVSVCITAYRTQDYIKECLDSVINQTWFRGNDNFEIIVGIDGCEQTLSYIKTIMGNYKNLKVLMMDSNKGTYITSNTIMSIAKYDNVFRFDSDDIMCSNLIETVMKNKGDCRLVRYRFQDFNTSKKGGGYAHGTIYVKKSVFVKYGGFRPWPCSADTEIYKRLKNVENTKNLRDILMLRRVHESSLTHSNETGMNSDLRKRYKYIIERTIVTRPEDAVIKMVTNTYTEVTCQEPAAAEQDEYVKTLKHIVVNEPVPVQQKNSISSLRKDISSGKLIRVPVNGGFVWKRIK